MTDQAPESRPAAQHDLQALTERLQRLEEIERARGLPHHYAHTMDDPRPAAAAGLFTKDGELTTPGGVFRGRAEIERFFVGAIDRDRSDKRHFITSPRTTWLGPGRVRLESYFWFTGRTENASLIGWGIYDDVVDVSGDEPLFARKSITPHLRTDLVAGWPSELG